MKNLTLLLISVFCLSILYSCSKEETSPMPISDQQESLEGFEARAAPARSVNLSPCPYGVTVQVTGCGSRIGVKYAVYDEAGTLLFWSTRDQNACFYIPGLSPSSDYSITVDVVTCSLYRSLEFTTKPANTYCSLC